MVIEEYAKKWKEGVFSGLSVKDRHSQFFSITNKILTKTKKITQSDYDALVLMVVDDRLEASHKVNKFLKCTASKWLDEIFEVTVKPKKVEQSIEQQEEFDDDEYDPKMLALAGEHPEEWSKEVVRKEIASNDKWSEDE